MFHTEFVGKYIYDIPQTKLSVTVFSNSLFIVIKPKAKFSVHAVAMLFYTLENITLG
jgi:hypothetical protein